MKAEIEIKTPTVITSGDYILNLDLLVKEEKKSLFRVKKEDLFYYIIKNKNEGFITKYKQKLSTLNAKTLDIYSDIVVKDDFLIWPEINQCSEEFMETRQQVLDYLGYFYKKDDKNYYLPYIPGSTVKGTIRNAILSYVLKQSQLYYSEHIEEENLALYTNEFNKRNFQLRDVFRFIQVSDFRIKDINNLKLGIGLVKRITKSDRSGKIPVYTFYLPIGTKFEGEINVSIDLKKYIKNNLKKLNKTKIINDMVLINYNNGELHTENIIKFLFKVLNDFTNDVVKSSNYGFIFQDYNVSLSNGTNGIYDAFIGRFKGKYLNLPRLPNNIKTFPIIFVNNNKKYKMGHIQITLKGV
ncbi:MAG: type III-A CRISPR-associated RAMP protein Csm5 [Thermoplasmata archaeon]